MELYWVHSGFSQDAKEASEAQKLQRFLCRRCVRDSQNEAVNRYSGATLQWISTRYPELSAIKADELKLKCSGFSTFNFSVKSIYCQPM